MIRDLVDAKPLVGEEGEADLDQLIYDVGHGTGLLAALMIEDWANASQIHWLAERVAEQALLLQVRFIERGRL